nr:hypothetical protein [Enterocloster clostridioformis]
MERKEPDSLISGCTPAKAVSASRWVQFFRFTGLKVVSVAFAERLVTLRKCF